MEIIAFLLLGLIAMLAIVPPIIRGRIEESPINSTRNFKKSMLEMAASVDPSHYRRELSQNRRRLFLSPLLTHGQGLSGTRIRNGRTSYSSPISQTYVQRYKMHRTSAVTRRRRVYFVLVFSSLLSGLFALALQNALAIGFFATFSGLFLLYITLVFIFTR